MKSHSIWFVVELLVAAALLLSGCSDPKSYDVTKLTEEQRKELGQKLTSDEGQKLAAWTMRHAITGSPTPNGLTVAQALKEQDDWIVKQKEAELQAAELRKKVEAERLAKQEEFKKLLSVVLVSKANKEQEYGQKFVTFVVAYENKGDKDIQGIKGVLKMTDIFGDSVLNVNWSFDEGVAAKQTYVERGSGMKINQFIDRQMKLWNMEFDKLKATFEVKTIIFKDGSKIDAPD